MAIAHETQTITNTAHSLYHFLDYGILVSVVCISYFIIKKLYLNGN